MIYEFFQTLFSDAPHWAKRQNLVQESVAIAARYRRQKDFWLSHLENCYKEIKAFGNAKKIAVFGSGYLLDFPAELLSNPELEIFLFDAVHPRAVRQNNFRAKCRLITCDLNMNAAELFKSYDLILRQCDAFISLNLLSQLALHGSQHLASQEKQRVVFAKGLVANHLGFLKSLPGPVLLISDFEKRFVDLKNEVILNETTLWGFQMPQPNRKWTWNLAPRGEVSKDFRIDLEVGVWTFHI